VSSRPTDFNDAAKEQGTDTVAEQLMQDLAALDAERQKEGNKPAQPLEGETQFVHATGSTEPVSVDAAERRYAPAEPPVADSPPRNAARHNEEWRLLLERNKEGNLKASVRNVELILRFDEGWLEVLGFCQLSYRIIKRHLPPMPDSELGEWAEEDAAALRVWMSHQYEFTPSHADINDALIVVSRSRKFHPVREFLQSLVWDGVSRLPTWLQKTFESTDDDRYLQLVGPKVLVAAVARVMDPGCKMDNVMILEGEQGRGKSTAIAILFGEWFSDSPIPIGDKEAYQLIHGKWGYELGELDSFNKAEVTQLKQFFSQQVDRFRPSYGRYAQDHPRQTQFWGTTNQDTYLRDYTGNRRFWPVHCIAVNKDWVRKHREQLWAEALHLYRTRKETGFQWWISQETPEQEEEFSLVSEAQDARLQRDPWEDLLRPWLEATTKAFVTSADILQECLGIDGAHMQQAHMNRLAPIMKSLGWRSTRKRVDNGRGKKAQMRVWESDEHKKRLEEVPL